MYVNQIFIIEFFLMNQIFNWMYITWSLQKITTNKKQYNFPTYYLDVSLKKKSSHKACDDYLKHR